MQDLFSVKDKRVLITGGSRGIGKMLAAGFVTHGAKVYISSRKADICDATAAELAKDGQCHSLPQDVSTVEGCAALAEQYSAHEEGLDVLINNAGAAWGAAFDDFPEAGWDKVMDLNVKSVFFLTQKLHDVLKNAASAERPAKVINISSIDGLHINPWETYSYQASKAGLIHLTRRMAARLIKDHIAVSSIAPGAFASDMNIAARDAEAVVANHIPQKRIGTAEDIAGTAIYLASRAGDYVVGETLAVDGGVTYSSLRPEWG